jgi:hypothetical protein
MRPSLGQPTSPIQTSFPTKISATFFRTSRTCSIALAAGLILLIGQNVDGHEIDRRGELRGLQPGLSNVGIGDGKA